jgi:hypothetical protein
MHLDLGPNRHVFRNKKKILLLLLLFYCGHESHIFHTNTKEMKVFTEYGFEKKESPVF